MLDTSDSVAKVGDVANNAVRVNIVAGGSGSGTVDTVSTNNSTTTPLGIAGVFTGGGDDVLNYKSIVTEIFSDKDSATLGIAFQWSPDNANWDTTERYDYIAANGGAPFIVSTRARYFRLVYTNGGTAQVTFRVQTVLKTSAVTELHDRVKNVPLANDPTINVHAVISGETTAGGGAFVNVKVNPSGTLTVAASQDTTPWVVSGTVAATQSGTWTVQPGNTPNTAPWLTESVKVASANNTGSCPSGAVNTTALASNASRRGVYMAAASNNTDDIFVKLGATATSANFRLAPGQSFNILTGSIYTGIIDFFPNSGTQALCVAELN